MLTYTAGLARTMWAGVAWASSHNAPTTLAASPTTAVVMLQVIYVLANSLTNLLFRDALILKVMA